MNLPDRIQLLVLKLKRKERRENKSEKEHIELLLKLGKKARDRGVK